MFESWGFGANRVQMSTTIKCDECDTAHHLLVHPEPNVANAAKDGTNGTPAEEKAA